MHIFFNYKYANGISGLVTEPIFKTFIYLEHSFDFFFF